MSTNRNFSNENLTTQQIMLILNLYYGIGIPDWFLENVVSPDLSNADKAEIRRNFPRANYLAWIIERVAYSMPMFEVTYSPKNKPAKEKAEFTPTGDPEKDKAGKEQFEADQAIESEAAESAVAAKREKIEDLIRQMQERQIWEGEQDFWASVPLWRIFLFLCGDTFAKLPWDDDVEGIAPERMGPQYTMIQLSGKRKKAIGGYRFEYPIGTLSFTTDPLGENTRIEVITKEKWTVTDTTVQSTGGPRKEKEGAPAQDLKAKNVDFIPVSHMAFKEREDHPRGLPFALAIMDKALHIYAIQLTRRLGNKYNGAPIIVRLNASGSAPNFRPGETHDVYDKSPLHKADVKAVGGGLSMQSTEEEYQDAIKELEDLAFLPHEGRDQTAVLSAPSGQASEQLSKSQVAFRESFTRKEGSFYGDLFYKMLKLEGAEVERTEITCQYDPVTQPTAEQKQTRAETLFAQKFMRQALTEMGYEEDQIDGMIEERDEEVQKANDAFMAGNTMPTGDEDEEEEEKKKPPIPQA